MFALPPLPRTLEASVRDLSSEKEAVRASAIIDLVRHAHLSDDVRSRAISLLVKALQDDSARVRSDAATAMADLGAQEALPHLLLLVEDQHPHVRQMAINALGEIGDERAAPRMVRALSDARPELRYQAVIAISRISKDDETVVPHLDKAFDDADHAVQHIALRVAEERFHGGLPVSHPLMEHAKRLLDHASIDVSLAAAIFLSKMGEAAGHAIVLAVVAFRANAKPNKEDEEAAVELCGEANLREAIPALEKRVWGVTSLVRDTSAFHAKIALARMGHERARREILSDLGSRRLAVSSAAVVSSGRARLIEALPALRTLSPTSADPNLIAEAMRLLEEVKV